MTNKKIENNQKRQNNHIIPFKGTECFDGLLIIVPFRNCWLFVDKTTTNTLLCLSETKNVYSFWKNNSKSLIVMIVQQFSRRSTMSKQSEIEHVMLFFEKPTNALRLEKSKKKL